MKTFLIWLGKVALMIALLAAAGIGCFLIILSQVGLGWGHNSRLYSIFDLLLDIVLFLAIFVLYIFICVKISRLGTEKPNSSASFWEKAKQPLITIIPAIAISLLCFWLKFMIFIF